MGRLPFSILLVQRPPSCRAQHSATRPARSFAIAAIKCLQRHKGKQTRKRQLLPISQRVEKTVSCLPGMARFWMRSSSSGGVSGTL